MKNQRVFSVRTDAFGFILKRYDRKSAGLAALYLSSNLPSNDSFVVKGLLKFFIGRDFDSEWEDEFFWLANGKAL